MSISETEHQKTRNSETHASFQFKGGLYPLTSIQLFTSTALERLAAELDQKLQQAPKFFHNAPMVIDLQKINHSDCELNFIELKEILSKRHLIAVGVKNGNAVQHEAASRAGFAILQENLKSAENEANNTSVKKQEENGCESTDKEDNQFNHRKSNKETNENLNTFGKDKILEDIQGSNTRVITEPVRSGQQIYARGGDLIVLAPVSHGAELLADGHIHIYGPLRGRALAGITGDVNAHIFCLSLESELISVAGQYKISEDISADAWQKSVNIFLEDGRLQIRAL